MFKKAFLTFFICSFGFTALAQNNADTLRSAFQKRYFHKDKSLMLSKQAAIGNPFAYSVNDNKDNSFGLNGLSRSGNISRAITIGNNQDLSLNSSLNLQLSGRLSEDLEVIAVISDDNIPIQPEGNTQQIQDFDRVYIQLLNKNYSITAGDFELRKPNSYFLNYFKKAKGAYAQTSFESANKYVIKNDASAAIAKGKYNRMVFLGKEGIQGPYRLQGLTNENFIIVLAGTERVFIDGVLLKRGENLDYTIDYNAAEITFMPKRVITAYSRITVEFEYSDKNYSRSLVTVNSSFENSKNKFRFNYYNEQDSKNKSLLQNLDNNQKLFLSTIGDQTSQAYYPSADSVGFSSSEIRYKKIDSLGTTVFVYSVNPEDAIYRLNFSQLGNNLGNYVQEQSLANGRVFKWVAPINGIPQGNFEPVVILVAPRKSSMFTFYGEHQSNKKIKIGSELAISQTDLNLFSKIDDADNTGIASKSFVEYKELLKKDSAGDLFLNTQMQLEVLNKEFRFVEFYRPVEFNRDFNLSSTIKSPEQWLSFQISLQKNSKNLIYYKTSIFFKDTIYKGLQQTVGTDLKYKTIKLFSTASLLNTQLNNNRNKSDYLKHYIELSKESKLTTIGLSEETERNLFKNKNNDTLAFNSFSFKNYRIYLKSPENWISNYLLEYSNRFDENPYQNSLRASTRAENILLNTELNKNTNALFGFNLNYRKLNVISTNTNLKSEENLISRIRFDGNAFKSFLNTSTFYEIGTGQEPKRSYTYIQVPAGQGTYIYKDYNNNGIKELNEFEIAKYSYEADYIRVSILNSDFVRTKSTSISQNINLEPSRIWSNKKNILKFISMFSNQINYKIERKTLKDGNDNILNPFDLKIVDSSLITLNTQYRESFYFNRSNPIFGADYTVQGNRNKNLLSIGFESRSYTEQIVRTRWNFLERFSFNSEIKSGEKKAVSEAASERNYTISYIGIKPEFGFQYSTEWRWNLAYSFLNQENLEVGAEKSEQHKIGTELKYNAGGKSSIQTQFNFIYNNYTGNTNSAIAYEMLEALQVGKNLTWSANWQKNIGPSLQLSIIYEGRSSETAKTIHSGSMQARAFF